MGHLDKEHDILHYSTLYSNHAISLGCQVFINIYLKIDNNY